MATTDHTCKYDEGFVKFLIQYHPKYKELNQHTLNIITQDGLWQRDRLAEIIIETLSNGILKHQSEYGHDLIQLHKNKIINKIDVKTITLRYRIKRYYNKTKTKTYHTNTSQIDIKNLQAKTSELRIICYDYINDKMRFFIIWNYSNTKTLSFCPSHNSKYLNGENGIEVFSIQELATYIPPKKSKKDILNIIKEYKHHKTIKQKLPGVTITSLENNNIEIIYNSKKYILNTQTNTMDKIL